MTMTMALIICTSTWLYKALLDTKYGYTLFMPALGNSYSRTRTQCQDPASSEVNAGPHLPSHNPEKRKICMFAWFDLFVRQRDLDIFCLILGNGKDFGRHLLGLYYRNTETQYRQVRSVASARLCRFSE